MLPWIIVVIFIIFYWKCVYYPHHESDAVPISLFLLGLFLGSIGLFYFLAGQITTPILMTNVIPVYTVFVLFMAAAYSLIYIGYKNKQNHINRHIDVFLSVMKKLKLWSIVPLLIAISFPLVLFIVMGTFILFGSDHIYIWGLVFIGWIASDIRLINYIEKIKTK